MLSERQVTTLLQTSAPEGSIWQTGCVPPSWVSRFSSPGLSCTEDEQAGSQMERAPMWSCDVWLVVVTQVLRMRSKIPKAHEHGLCIITGWNPTKGLFKLTLPSDGHLLCPLTYSHQPLASRLYQWPCLFQSPVRGGARHSVPPSPSQPSSSLFPSSYVGPTSPTAPQSLSQEPVHLRSVLAAWFDIHLSTGTLSLKDYDCILTHTHTSSVSCCWVSGWGCPSSVWFSCLVADELELWLHSICTYVYLCSCMFWCVLLWMVVEMGAFLPVAREDCNCVVCLWLF